MANREQRNSREKKKPKAEKNKTKNQSSTSLFSSNRNTPASGSTQASTEKKNP